MSPFYTNFTYHTTNTLRSKGETSKLHRKSARILTPGIWTFWSLLEISWNKLDKLQQNYDQKTNSAFSCPRLFKGNWVWWRCLPQIRGSCRSSSSRVSASCTVQAHDAFGHLVLLDYNIGLRPGNFTYKSLRNHVQNITYFPHTLYVYATAMW